VNVPRYGYSRTARFRHQPKTNTAFSLAETVVSVALVGGLLVVALNTVGDATLGRQKMGDRGRGHLLAQDLMTEILQKAYEEPDDTPTFGPEASESTGSRTAFDDVDDYDGWSASPPQEKDGTEIPDLTAWERSVTVEYVAANHLTTVVGSDQGIKRITVTVTRNDLVVCSLVGVRTSGADESQPRD